MAWAPTGCRRRPVLSDPVCERLADVLPEVAAGNVLLAADDRRHVSDCGRCGDELTDHRQLHRALRQLSQLGIEPPEGLLEEILAAVDAAGARPVVVWMRGRRVAYVSGLAAATAAAAGGALVLASRSRRRFRLAS